MMKNIDTLTGPDMNRAVAMALGMLVYHTVSGWMCRPRGVIELMPLPNYTGDIAVAWPIIEDHDIDIFNTHTAEMGFKATLNLKPYQPHLFSIGYGTTRLEAVMRALLHSVYGEEIELDAY
jgi:hypothetical protein